LVRDSFHETVREHVSEIEAGCGRLLDGPTSPAFATDVRRMLEAGALLTRGAAAVESESEPWQVAHRLRNPLAALLGYSEFLREDAPADAALELDRIHEVAERLLQLVDAEFG
jgi:signal transduction histidine kinase